MINLCDKQNVETDTKVQNVKGKCKIKKEKFKEGRKEKSREVKWEYITF